MHNKLSPSLFSLLIANIAVIVIAVIQRWPAPVLLWTYWLQSIIIGLFQALKMADLENFSTEGLKFNNALVPPTSRTKKLVVVFFLLHYGLFHLIYAVFLRGFSPVADWQAVIFPSGIFFINHALSFFLNRRRDKLRPQNIGLMMFAPYRRIIPMHIIIILGALLSYYNAAVLIAFLVFKALTDAALHGKEHQKWEKIPI